MNPRVAIIGCGRITMESHLPAWQAAAAAGRCSLVGVTDLDPTRAQRAAAQAGVPAYPSVEALLDEAHPDIVLIATLLDRHHDLAIQALEAGCHVLCEKPIARNATEASAMVDAAKRAGRLLSICFQYRSLPEVRYLREQLASGEFGAILSIRTWGTDVRGLPVNRPWPRGGGGALNHFTSHNLDLALWLLGFPAVVSASAVGWQRLPRIGVAAVPMTGGLQRADAVPADIEDLGHALVRFADGSALMLFRIRDKSSGAGNVWAGGTLRRADGTRRVFNPGEVAFTPLRHWRSAASGANYPVAMRLKAGELEFELEPLMDDQELDSRASTGTIYWEGAVRAKREGGEGRELGRGYLELTGYWKPLKL